MTQRLLNILFVILFGLSFCVCSGKPSEKITIQQTVPDSLSRPGDIGEHKSIHQEEWEYYQKDSSGTK